MKFHVKMEGTGNDSKLSFGQNKTPFHDSKVHFVDMSRQVHSCLLLHTEARGKGDSFAKGPIGKAPPWEKLDRGGEVENQSGVGSSSSINTGGKGDATTNFWSIALRRRSAAVCGLIPSC